jgi:hypothetical protein
MGKGKSSMKCTLFLLEEFEPGVPSNIWLAREFFSLRDQAELFALIDPSRFRQVSLQSEPLTLHEIPEGIFVRLDSHFAHQLGLEVGAIIQQDTLGRPLRFVEAIDLETLVVPQTDGNDSRYEDNTLTLTRLMAAARDKFASKVLVVWH